MQCDSFSVFYIDLFDFIQIRCVILRYLFEDEYCGILS